MSDDLIAAKGLSKRFWERKTMAQMSQDEWEALCDGCGKCCLNKLEDEDSGEVVLTNIACRLLDDSTCLCAQYDIRHQFIPECIVLTASNIPEHLYWMPQTCAYRLVHEGRPLKDWHPLISGHANSVHAAGVSVKDKTVPEFEIDEDDWEEHVIEEPL
ncbi:YcgN family cysteine cluster protein [Planktotalea sp.]|uniref:YcgN family cysteine cluster protein n=1 Tax=Planktotalea sp. TaxID=2029877 RepID=UPI0025F4593C|nr:YcgN family cysteine cluster protein [Planktotalea sp.]